MALVKVAGDQVLAADWNGVAQVAGVYGADSVGTDAYAITPTPSVAAYVAGMSFSFKAGTANTGAATLAVSGLSALAIKRPDGLDVRTGDIISGQIIRVQYDGTNFQMISHVKILYSSGASSKDLADASTTQNIAHGLGITPTSFKISGIGPSTGVVALSISGNSVSHAPSNTLGSAGVTTSFNFSVTSGAYQDGVVTADATNIIITWTKTGSPTGTARMIWEAFG